MMLTDGDNGMLTVTLSCSQFTPTHFLMNNLFKFGCSISVINPKQVHIEFMIT
jgi:hypothetical protein